MFSGTIKWSVVHTKGLKARKDLLPIFRVYICEPEFGELCIGTFVMASDNKVYDNTLKVCSHNITLFCAQFAYISYMLLSCISAATLNFVFIIGIETNRNQVFTKKAAQERCRAN